MGMILVHFKPWRTPYILHFLPDSTHLIKWLSIQDAWEKLLKSERYNQKDDFTVVLQPSLQETNLLHRLVSKLESLYSFCMASAEAECNVQLALSCLGGV